MKIVVKKIKKKLNLAIVLYDFNGSNSNELSIRKDEILIVTNWNIKDGWATGYKKHNPYEQGIFPSALVRKYEGLFIYIYNFNLNS